MSKFTDDPEFTAEMLTMMGKELKQARQRIKDLESFKEAYTANDVLSPDAEDRLRDFRERTMAAEEAMEIMSNHVRNVNKENQRLREQVANLQSCLVKQEDIETPKREYRNQGVNVRTKEQDDLKTQVEELEGALEKYYSKYVVAKRAKAELEEEIDSLNSANGTLEMKHKDLVAQVDCIQKEKEALLSRNEELETQIGDVKAEIVSRILSPV
ncbi:hypothetical protein BJ165DRAFT_746719 [Panaeolus papilionaceus]|nr:hypothetical protein BJ165DRAFT_746719 [Panaeolus papilionaceus]